MRQTIKVIFLGSPDFAVPCLKALCEDGRFQILSVITQPDKPAGRGRETSMPPIKRFALEKGIDVWQPEKLRDIKDRLSDVAPDFLVVVAYGKLVPKDILSIPKYGCVNVHGSILPRYRGAAVLQAPILNGDDKTGVTIMQMDEGLDTGPIIKISEMPLRGAETVQDIHDGLSRLGAETLPQALIDLSEGNISPQAQKGSSTYVREIKKEDGKIDWSKPAKEIERMVRAYTPWPSAFSTIKLNSSSKKIKILSVEHETIKGNGLVAGEIFLKDGKLSVQCGDGAIILTQVQLEGGKALGAPEFLNGHKKIVGTKLG